MTPQQDFACLNPRQMDSFRHKIAHSAGILVDTRKPGDLEKARHAGYCISVGGSITGEHGVDMEKNELMDRLSY